MTTPTANPTAAAVLWTAGGVRPQPILTTLARELRAEADGYRIGHSPNVERARHLRSAARMATLLRVELERLEATP